MATLTGFLFECPDCGCQSNLPRTGIGQAFTCPNCQGSTIVPPPVATSMPPALNISTTPLPVALSAADQAALASAVPVAKPSQPTTSRIGTPAPQTPPGTGSISRTLEFTCTACNGRMRLPSQYLGKSILCPKCNQPQKVIVRMRPADPMVTTRSIRKPDGDMVGDVPARPATRSFGPKRAFNTPLPSTMEAIDAVAISPNPGSSSGAKRPVAAPQHPATASISRPGTASFSRPATTSVNRPATASISRAAPTATAAPAAPVPPATPMASPMTMMIPAQRTTPASATAGAGAGPGAASATMRPVILEEPPVATSTKALLPWMVGVAVLAITAIGLGAWLAVTVPALATARSQLATADNDRRSAMEGEIAARHKVEELAKNLSDTERSLGEAKSKIEQLEKAAEIRDKALEKPATLSVVESHPASDSAPAAEPSPAKP